MFPIGNVARFFLLKGIYWFERDKYKPITLNKTTAKIFKS